MSGWRQQRGQAVTVAVMAKQPTPGLTKTRLTPPLTAEEAASLARCFLLDSVEQLRTLAESEPQVTPAIAAAPTGAGPYFQKLAPEFDIIPQVGDDLGQRLHHVLTRALDAGDEAIAINSDSPTLPARLLREAVRLIRQPAVDVVFGPAEDGGYYLIGVSAPPGALVTDVEMSTPNVLADSLAIAAEQQLRVALLDPWYDVDDAYDLNRLRADINAGVATGANTRRFFKPVSS